MLDVDTAGVVGPGRPRLEWRKGVEKDGSKMGLLSEDLLDRPKWGRVTEIEDDKNSRVMFRAARQAVRERKDFVGTGCIHDEMGKMCYCETEDGRLGRGTRSK